MNSNLYLKETIEKLAIKYHFPLYTVPNYVLQHAQYMYFFSTESQTHINVILHLCIFGSTSIYGLSNNFLDQLII